MLKGNQKKIDVAKPFGKIDGKDKSVFWPFSGASPMVYKFMDPCLREYFWYKGNTDI